MRNLILLLLVSFLPASAHALVKTYIPVQTGTTGPTPIAGVNSPGPGASPNAGLTGQTNISIGKTSLITVHTPGVQVRTQSAANADSVPQSLTLTNSIGTQTSDRAPLSAARTQDSGSVAAQGNEGKEPQTRVEKLDKAIEGIDKAIKEEEEKKVPSGAVSSKLDRLFDFSQEKSRGSFDEGLPGEGGKGQGTVALNGLPDPAKVGVDKAIGKLSALASNANPADAALLYQRAVDIARVAKKNDVSKDLLAKAAQRAKASVNEAGNLAFEAAAKGRTTDALRYTRSVHGWNNLLSSPQRPLIGNFPAFKNAVKHVLGQALESPGKDLPAPTVAFEKPPGKIGAQLTASITTPEGVAPPIETVPAQFALNLALPEAVVAWQGAGELSGPKLEKSFGLSAQAGFTDFFRAYRKANNSVLKSFWMAARRVLSDSAGSLLQRLRAFVLSVLRGIGIISSGAGIQVDGSASALKDLRNSPSKSFELPISPALKGDGRNLGYQLYPAAP